MKRFKAEDLYSQARADFEAKSYSEAIRSLRRLLHIQGYADKALANIGASLYHLNHFKAAQKYLSKAIALQPDYILAQRNLGNVLVALGSHQEAITHYRKAINIEPLNDDSWNALFESLHLVGQIEECEILVNQWKTYLPGSKKLRMAIVLLCRDNGKYADAIRNLNTLLTEDSDNARYNSLMSELLLNTKQLDDALAYIGKAIQCEPKCIQLFCIQANIYYFMSKLSECAKSYERALALSPNSAALFLNQFLLFPIIPSSVEEINICRAKFLKYLASAENNLELELVLQHPIALHTFPLAYHAQNDRLLLERYYKLMKRLTEPLLNQLAISRKTHKSNNTKSTSTKIRIGFLSRFFYGHSNTLAFEGIIRHLNRDRFIVTLIHAAGSQVDNIQKSLNACCDEVVTLTSNLADTYNTLHNLSLDILYFTDLGMNSYDFLIPFFRSCKIQLTGWGIPHTSGNPDIDYYISVQGVEPEDANEQYTERLIRLPGGLPCCFLSSEPEGPSVPREYFFLPSHCQLIGCLQSLHKIHPDFDLLMEEIAIQNPEAIFIFVEDAISYSTERFIQRISEHAPTVRTQSLFLRVMGRVEYQALCRCMDILLDPIYYGSGITFFEASLVGTPIITLEGNSLRSRTVSAGYREMNLADSPIAKTAEEYVNLASELLCNDARRKDMRNKILSHNPLLFNRMDFVKNFEDFCLTALGSKTYPFIGLSQDSERLLNGA